MSTHTIDQIKAALRSDAPPSDVLKKNALQYIENLERRLRDAERKVRKTRRGAFNSNF